MKTLVKGKIKELKVEYKRLQRQLKWLKDRADARYFYKNSDMNVVQIARLLRISETTVSNMIDGKNLPKWFKAMKDKTMIVTIEKGEVKVKIEIDKDTNRAEIREKIQSLINSIDYFEMKANTPKR